MFKVILKSLLTVITVMVPLLVTLGPVLNAVPADVLGLPRDRAVAVGWGVIAALFLGVIEMVDVARPKADSRRFAKDFIKRIVFQRFEDTLKDFGLKLGADVRVNVMFGRPRSLARWVGYFEWFAHAGFDPQPHGAHKDLHLPLLTHQGVAGTAFRAGRPELVDLRTPGRSFRLLGFQRTLTQGVLAILSVPLFREVQSDPNKKWKVVGVVNLDAMSEAGATWLVQNGQTMSDYFKDYGVIIAQLP